MLEPSAARVAVWEALSELCLDTALQAEDFARISRVLVDAGLGDAAIARAWLREVGPVCAPNLLSVAGEWAMFDRDWLVAEITRARTWVGRATRAVTRKALGLARLPDWPDWIELQAWVALRRAPASALAQELRAPAAARRQRAVLVAAERDAASVAHMIDDAAPAVRCLALARAQGLRPDRIAPYLDDADEDVRRAAAAALAHVATAGDLAHVLGALARGDMAVRGALADVPWRIADIPDAIAALGRMLGQTAPGARAGAARACTAFWADAARRTSPADARHRPLRDALRLVAAGASAEARAAAVTALGWWQAWTGEAAVDLAALAHDADADVRCSVAYALGHARRADADALAALGHLLAGERTCMAALFAAERLGARAASLRPHARRLLHAPSMLVRVSAERCVRAMDQI